MARLSPSHCFSLQGEQVQGPPDGLPGGEGRDNDALSQSDAAAICAGLWRKCYLAGRVYNGRDYSSIQRLESYLYVEAAGLAADEGWKMKGFVGVPVLRALSQLAVVEMLDPAPYKGHVGEAARVAWFGSHIKVKSDRVWPMWERTWRKRYQALYQILERWVSVADGHVWHNQDDDTTSSG